MRLEREPSSHRDPAAVLPTVSDRSVGVAVSDTGVVAILIGSSVFTVEDPGSKTVAEQLAEVSAIAMRLLGQAEKAQLGEAVGS